MKILNFDIPLQHRLTVTMPMAALGLVDNIVCLLTVGYVQPGLSLDWGFRQALCNARRARRPVSKEADRDEQEPDERSVRQ